MQQHNAKQNPLPSGRESIKLIEHKTKFCMGYYDPNHTIADLKTQWKKAWLSSYYELQKQAWLRHYDTDSIIAKRIANMATGEIMKCYPDHWPLQMVIIHWFEMLCLVCGGEAQAITWLEQEELR